MPAPFEHELNNLKALIASKGCIELVEKSLWYAAAFFAARTTYLELRYAESGVVPMNPQIWLDAAISYEQPEETDENPKSENTAEALEFVAIPVEAFTIENLRLDPELFTHLVWIRPGGDSDRRREAVNSWLKDLYSSEQRTHPRHSFATRCFELLALRLSIAGYTHDEIYSECAAMCDESWSEKLSESSRISEAITRAKNYLVISGATSHIILSQ